MQIHAEFERYIPGSIKCQARQAKGNTSDIVSTVDYHVKLDGRVCNKETCVHDQRTEKKQGWPKYTLGMLDSIS